MRTNLMTLPMPTLRRYLRVLDEMTRSVDFDRRCFARAMIRDITEPGINAADILAPVIDSPMHKLNPCEQWLRRQAEGVSVPSSTSWPVATAGVRHALTMEA